MIIGLETLGVIFGASIAAVFAVIKGGLAVLGFSSIGPVLEPQQPACKPA